MSGEAEPAEGAPRRGALTRTTAAGATVAGAIVAVDALLATPAAAPVAFGLGALSGAVGGAAFALLAHLPRTKRSAALALGAVALVATISWAIALGAIRRWGSEHHALALALWIAAPLAAAGVVALGLLTRPAERWSWLAGHGWATGTVLLGALALGGADGVLFPDTYPLFHRLLKTLAWLAGTAAFTAFLERRPLPIRTARLLGAGLALTVPLALLTTHLSGPTAAAIAARPWAGFVLGQLRAVADVDGDGYAGVLHGGDCAPFDAEVGPSAVEVPGNGVDDDCVGGDAPERAPRLALPPVPDSPSPRSVVLITIDALRADRLGLYGHDRPTSPAIDAFFGDGLIFQRAYTAGGYTSIALPALMRGVPARRIEWARVVQTNALRLMRPPLPTLPDGERFIYSYTLPLDDPHPTWAELLERRAMPGVAIVDDGASDFLAARWGTGAGFATYETVDVPFGAADGDDRVARRALARMPSGPEPFFLWLHFYGPHWPDAEHAGVPRFGDSMVDRYDHEVAHVDRMLAPILERLAARDDAVVLLTSDHGEVFQEPRRGHGRTMDEAAIRVPLLLRGPTIEGGRRPDVVSTLDVFPTLLAATETPAPESAGVSLLAEPDPDRVVLVDSWVFGGDGQPELDLTAAIHRRGKLVRDRLRRTGAISGDPAVAALLEAAIAAYYANGAAPRVDGGTLAAE